MADRQTQDNAAAIVAAAQKRRTGKHTAQADDAEVVESLRSMGVINGGAATSDRSPRLRELAGRARLKGFEHETAKQTNSGRANDSEIIASLKRMGVLGDDK